MSDRVGMADSVAADRGHRRPSRRTLAVSAATVVAAALLLYLLLPRLAGLDDTWRRLDDGDGAWLVAAAALEIASYASYVVLFHAVFARRPARLDWRDSTLITLAGVAATRLFAAGGAGGVALTAWAVRRSGVPGRVVGARVTALLVLLYGVFMVALVVGGLGLRTGVLPGRDPFGLTVVPALFGGVVIVVALTGALVPHDLARDHGSRVLRWLGGAAATVGDGVREALRLAASGDVRLLGAVTWWAFDVAVLWACLHAFGGAPEPAVVVMAYFVGQLGNLLPLPGGVGGVDGAMIGALIGFGIPGGLAIAAVLSYRALAFWLPTVPGVLAYLVLLRQSPVRGAP